MRIKIVCISLEKSVDRREFMRKQFDSIKGIPFEFFNAIDATELELVSFGGSIYKIYYKGIDTGLLHDKKIYVQETATSYGRRHYRNFRGIPYANVQAIVNDNIVTINYEGQSFYTDISSYKKELSITELACALSHYYVTKQLVNDDNYDFYIVLEDDVVVFSDSANTNIDTGAKSLGTILKHLVEYDLFWDIAWLNHPQHITANSLIGYSDLFNLSVFSGYSGSYSFILNKKGAKKLMSSYTQEETLTYVNRFPTETLTHSVNMSQKETLTHSVNMAADDFLANQVHLCQLRLKKPICWPSDEFESIVKTDLYL